MKQSKYIQDVGKSLQLYLYESRTKDITKCYVQNGSKGEIEWYKDRRKFDLKVYQKTWLTGIDTFIYSSGADSIIKDGALYRRVETIKWGKVENDDNWNAMEYAKKRADIMHNIQWGNNEVSE